MRHLLFVGTNSGMHIAQREGHVLQETGEGWNSAGHSLVNHRVNSLSVQAGTVLAGTAEGIFRFEDLGQTWRPASKGLTEPHVRGLAHHSDGSGRVLAGTEPATIFLSPDGGQTWAERPEVAALRDEHGWYLPYSPEAGCVRGFAFAFDGQRVYAAVEVDGLLRSDDGGETWDLAPGSSGQRREQRNGFIHPNVHSVACHPWSPDLVFAPTGGGLYRSKDGGETWEEEAAGLDVPWPRHMVERFLRVDRELLAAPLLTLDWRPILPEAGWVRAVAAMKV